MGAFWNYFGLKNQAQQQEQPQQQQQLQIDTSDPLNWLASNLTSPAEREAQEQRMLKNKRRMIAWTGLFDGLRNLANLWGVSKGAAPMKFTDNPYQQLEQGYQQERQRQNSLLDYRDKYATTLYNLQRQANEDKMKQESHQAQIDWYKDRSEIAQQKAELEKFKAVRVIKNKDGSLMKFDPINGTIEPLSEADPLYVELMQGKIAQQNKKTGLLGATKTTVRTGADGKTTTSVTSYGSCGGNQGAKKIKGYKKSGNDNGNKGKGKAY